MRSRLKRLALVGAAACLTILAACPEDFGPLAPDMVNEVDTLSLWALSGSQLHLPSAYDLKTRSAVRPYQTVAFDFAFDLTPTGEARLFPSDALGLTGRSGLQMTTSAFPAVLVAPTGGYVDSSAVDIAADAVVLVQSRPDNCFVGVVPYYAKLHVLTVDLVERRLDIEILTDANCGYRGLEPGLPTR